MGIALAVSRSIEDQTGWSVRPGELYERRHVMKFVRTARRYRTIEIQAGPSHGYRA